MDQYSHLNYQLLAKLYLNNTQDLTLGTRYASLDETLNNCENCINILEKFSSQLDNNEASRILGQAYVRKNQVEKAYQLLNPYVRSKMKQYHQAEKDYNQALDNLWQQTIAALKAGKASPYFYSQYDKATKEQQDRLVNDYFTKQREASEKIIRLKNNYIQSARIVPVALDLDLVLLNRSLTQTSSKLREQTLKQAEKTFLSVQKYAGDSDEYQLYTFLFYDSYLYTVTLITSFVSKINYNERLKQVRVFYADLIKRCAMKRSAALIFVISFLTACGGGSSPANNPVGPPPARDLANLKIIASPQGGMYTGQYEWSAGDISTFEQAIGKKAALWSRQWPMDNFDEVTGQPVFPVDEANQAWNNGQIVLANGFDINVGPGNPFSGFTIDKLLNGDYNAQLDVLAEQLRAFGKPVIFMSGREPNGILSDYFGGFGPDGNESFSWAVQNQAGFAEFDPSIFPNPELYTDLADPTVCDGVERLAAAQRYYHHYLVDVKGLKFLTFEGMGWGLTTIDQVLAEAIDNGAGAHEQALIQSCYDYRNFYPGNDYVDWVSLNYYTVDFFKDAWPQFNLPADILISTQTYLDRLTTIMLKVREVAPGKPVLLIELGFPDGTNPDSARAAERVTTSMNAFITDFPEISGFAFWSSIPIPETFDPTSPLYWPFDSLLRPNTQQGDAMKAIINANPTKFYSCVYLSDGMIMPNCTP